MAKTRFLGGFHFPAWPRHANANVPSLETGAPVLDAVGERYCLIGSVQWADGGTHDLRTIHFRTGTSNLSGTLTVSVRDVDLVNGPPGRDDGTADQSVDQASPAGSTNYGLTLGADRTNVATGTELAVVFEVTARTAGQVIIVSYNTTGGNGSGYHRPLTSTFLASVWAVGGGLAAVTFEAADGTFGIFQGAMPRISAGVNTHTFNSGSAADEFAMSFTVPVTMWAVEAGFAVTTVAGGDFSIVLYEGTTAKATVAVDANSWAADATGRWVHVNFPDVQLTPGNTYYLAIKPTTATNVSIYSIDVTVAAHLQAWVATAGYSTRVDAGSWAAVTTTRCPAAYVGVGAFDSAGGRGGFGQVIMGSGRW